MRKAVRFSHTSTTPGRFCQAAASIRVRLMCNLSSEKVWLLFECGFYTRLYDRCLRKANPLINSSLLRITSAIIILLLEGDFPFLCIADEHSEMGPVQITSNLKLNGSHFGLPPSSIHSMTEMGGMRHFVWTMPYCTGPIRGAIFWCSHCPVPLSVCLSLLSLKVVHALNCANWACIDEVKAFTRRI